MPKEYDKLNDRAKRVVHALQIAQVEEVEVKISQVSDQAAKNPKNYAYASIIYSFPNMGIKPFRFTLNTSPRKRLMRHLGVTSFNEVKSKYLRSIEAEFYKISDEIGKKTIEEYDFTKMSLVIQSKIRNRIIKTRKADHKTALEKIVETLKIYGRDVTEEEVIEAWRSVQIIKVMDS